LLTTEEKLDRLTMLVDSLAASVVAHDDSIEAHDRQIEGLITVSETQKVSIDGLLASAKELRASVDKHDEIIANLERQWQAYLTRIAPI
jgi:chromosome segregation ATPase